MWGELWGLGMKVAEDGLVVSHSAAVEVLSIAPEVLSIAPIDSTAPRRNPGGASRTPVITAFSKLLISRQFWISFFAPIARLGRGGHPSD
jgi:hypothetical protein